MNHWLLALVAAITLWGCKQSPSSSSSTGASSGGETQGQGGAGAQLVSGKFTDLRVTPDFRFATAIRDPEPPRLEGAPPKMRVGELWAADLRSGDTRKLGEGVTNIPGGYLFSPDSRWVLFLSGYNAATQAGSAQLVDLTSKESKPVLLGGSTGFFTFSPDSTWVALIDGGSLKLGRVGNAELTTVSTDVSTAQFSPDGHWLAFRRKLTSGAALQVARVDSKNPPVTLAENVGEYVISPDSERIAYAVRSQKTRDTFDLSVAALGKATSRVASIGSSQFAFSQDGKWLVRIEGVRPEKLGNLVVGPSDGSSAHTAAEKVQSFALSPASNAVAALAQYDQRQRWGTLQVAKLDGGAAQTVGEKVTDFDWDPTGKWLVFSARVLKPVFSVNLFLYGLGDTAARTVGEGVFGYALTNSGGLLFRTHCLRDGRSCELDALDLKEGSKPKTLLDGVYSFKPSEDGARVLLSFVRTDADAYDTGAYDLSNAKHRTLDTFTALPAHFAAKDGSRAVYLIDGQHKQGLFLAKDVP